MRLQIEIPDELGEQLDLLQLPADSYCRVALEEGVLRGQEARTQRAELAKLAAPPPPPAPPARSLHTLDQAAEFLQLTRDTVQRMVDRGELRGVRVGRSVRIPNKVLTDLAR